MRIIHCADLHLDAKMMSNFSNDMAKKRRLEILNTFENMVSFASENDVKIIIIAGDLFDTNEYTHKRIKDRVLSVIKNNPMIDFLYLKGNHDNSNYLDEYEKQIQNFKLFSKELKCYYYDNVTISGIEYSEKIKDEYQKLYLDESKFNILVLHGQESTTFSDNTENVNLNLLKNKNIDYLALGHIHTYKFEKLDQRGYYCYSGCIDGRGFDECGKKGFVLLQINEDNTFDKKFFVASSRIFYDIDVDVSIANDENDVYRFILENTEKITENDIVKINLMGEIKEELTIDTDYLKSKMMNRFYFVKINDKTNIRINYESYENDISLKGEFVRLLKDSQLGETEKSKIIQTGIKALLGKEF